MRLSPSRFVLHFRQSQEFLWEDQDQNLVWPQARVFLGPERLELTSRGVRFWNDNGLTTPLPPQIIDVPDLDWQSRVLIVSSDITEPLEARAVHVFDAPLIATPVQTQRFIVTGNRQDLNETLGIIILSHNQDRTIIETTHVTAARLRAQGVTLEEDLQHSH